MDSKAISADHGDAVRHANATTAVEGRQKFRPYFPGPEGGIGADNLRLHSRNFVPEFHPVTQNESVFQR